nr:hypothetical protein [Tanacetum cinerariifolium]
MVPGLAGGEWWRGCGSRGKWWSGAGNTREWSCRCGGKKGKGTVVLNMGGQGRYVCVIYTPMREVRIANVDLRCVLGCDIDLDVCTYGEDSEQQ